MLGATLQNLVATSTWRPGFRDRHSSSAHHLHSLWKLRIAYRVHNRCPKEPVLSQMSPEHAIKSYFWKFPPTPLIGQFTDTFFRYRSRPMKSNLTSTVIVIYNRYLLIYLLTYSKVQSPSWEANWFAASQEIPRISLNPKVHYRTHKRQPPISILGQPNPVHIPTFHLLEIHPNIIHPSTLRSPHRSLYLRFLHQDPIRPPLLTHTRHMPSPSHSSRFYHPHNIGWGIQII